MSTLRFTTTFRRLHLLLCPQRSCACRYDTAQNSLIGAKKQFADAVQNAEKQFLQDETIKYAITLPPMLCCAKINRLLRIGHTREWSIADLCGTLSE